MFIIFDLNIFQSFQDFRFSKLIDNSHLSSMLFSIWSTYKIDPNLIHVKTWFLLGSRTFRILAATSRKTFITTRCWICRCHTHWCRIYWNSKQSWSCWFLSKQRRPSARLSTLFVSSFASAFQEKTSLEYSLFSLHSRRFLSFVGIINSK